MSKRRLKYLLGKHLARLVDALQRPLYRLDSYAQSLWEQNCDCSKCVERTLKSLAGED